MTLIACNTVPSANPLFLGRLAGHEQAAAKAR
jgi:hypothetical protein